jgi:hypothetical protein
MTDSFSSTLNEMQNRIAINIIGRARLAKEAVQAEGALEYQNNHSRNHDN